MGGDEIAEVVRTVRLDARTPVTRERLTANVCGGAVAFELGLKDRIGLNTPISLVQTPEAELTVSPA